MSLYDDDDNPTNTKSEMTLKFLQAQIQQRRNNLAASNLLPQNVPRPLGSVVDLTGRARAAPLRPLRPITAKPIVDSALPMFIPKGIAEEKVLMFGEITIEREYQPAVPNDYYVYKKKKEEQEAREKAAREIAERLEKEHKEEMKKREKGAAFAPPSSLFEPEPEEEPEPWSEPAAAPAPVKFAMPSSTAPYKPFGQTGKGLGVAASIMSKMGYREGAGLGRDEQGISTALKVEQTGSKMGNIIAPEPTLPQPFAPTAAPMSQQAISDAMKNATKIVLLKNMVTTEEVDDELEPEIKEEMAKYGQVVDVVIHKVSSPTPEDEVRIFVEFTNVAQAIKAFIVQSGRFFAGRPVQASFHPMDDYNNKIYE